MGKDILIHYKFFLDVLNMCAIQLLLCENDLIFETPVKTIAQSHNGLYS